MTTVEVTPTAQTSAPPPPLVQPLQVPVMIRIAVLKPSPLQHRKTFRDLEELADSIRSHGILEPLLARKVRSPGSSYLELVFGERRLRAAKLAGLEEVPVIVRDLLSDREVLEIQLIENVQRADVDPVEEAEGYRVLHESHGYSAEDLAAKLGKSVAYVYARLKLCALGKAAREALSAGQLTASTALLVARIPAELQGEAVRDLAPMRDGDPIGARAAFDVIQRRYMLRLADAPFDRGDATLVPKAGSCGPCPKRTGSQPELFADVKATDTCTDPTCFETKRDAAWVRRKLEAKAAGTVVLEGKAAKEVFPYPGSGVAHTSGFVDLDQPDYSDPKHRSFRDRLGSKRLEEVTVTLARDERGDVHELVEAKAIKKLTPKPREVAETKPKASRGEAEAARLKRDAETAGELAAVAQIVAKLERQELNKTLWRILVERELHDAYGELDEVLERRGILDAATGALGDKAIAAGLDKMAVAELRGLYVELLVATEIGMPAPAPAPGVRLKESTFEQLCAALKIDVKPLVAKELARLKAEAKAPAKSAASADRPHAKTSKAGTKKK